MACKGCERRRKAWQAKQAAKRENGNKAQAAAIGAALAVIDAVAGEATDERETKNSDPEGQGSKG